MGMMPGIGGKKMPDLDSEENEKKMAQMEAIVLLYDSGGAAQSGSFESLKKTPDRKRRGALTLQKSTGW